MLAGSLASLCNVYVNDAFGTAHRAHASTEGVARPCAGYAGFLMKREVTELAGSEESGAGPSSVLGGAKVSDKIGVSTSSRSTPMLIGGAMSSASSRQG